MIQSSQCTTILEVHVVGNVWDSSWDLLFQDLTVYMIRILTNWIKIVCFLRHYLSVNQIVPTYILFQTFN